MIESIEELGARTAALGVLGAMRHGECTIGAYRSYVKDETRALLDSTIKSMYWKGFVEAIAAVERTVEGEGPADVFRDCVASIDGAVVEANVSAFSAELDRMDGDR